MIAPDARASRWASFAGVGAVGFAVQLGTLTLLTAWAGLPVALATALAVELTVLHNFAWHERWTWRDRAQRAPARLAVRLARFHAATGLVSLAGNVAITVVLVEWLELPVVVASTCAVGLLGIVNFVVADRYVFQPRATEHGSEELFPCASCALCLTRFPAPPGTPSCRQPPSSRRSRPESPRRDLKMFRSSTTKSARRPGASVPFSDSSNDA